MSTTERIAPEKADVWPDRSVGEKMTRREAEVARLVSQGLANKVVARLLGVREGTVKIHLHNIYRKLRVANRTGLTLSAIKDHR
jgi:two-component system nitrate/nitrite response regulator NarL